MGKQRSSVLRRKAKKLLELYPDKFSVSFEENKKMLNSLHIFAYKMDRDIVAGILVKLVKMSAQD